MDCWGQGSDMVSAVLPVTPVGSAASAVPPPSQLVSAVSVVQPVGYRGLVWQVWPNHRHWWHCLRSLRWLVTKGTGPFGWLIRLVWSHWGSSTDLGVGRILGSPWGPQPRELPGGVVGAAAPGFATGQWKGPDLHRRRRGSACQQVEAELFGDPGRWISGKEDANRHHCFSSPCREESGPSDGTLGPRFWEPCLNRGYSHEHSPVRAWFRHSTNYTVGEYRGLW